MTAYDDRVAPENRLLVCCARTMMSPQSIECARRVLREPLDWDYLLSAAIDNSIVRLFTRQVLSIGDDMVPVDRAESLRKAALAGSARSLLLTAELLDLLGKFRAEGMQAIPYKGPVAGAQAWGDAALREFEDLDLVVRQRELTIARAALSSLGYSAKFQLHHSPGEHAAGSAVPGEYQFRREDLGIIVELHTEHTLRHFPVPLPLDDFATRVVCVSLSGHSVSTFSAEDALLMLAVHGAKDFWDRLSWVVDIAEMLRSHGALDWDALWNRAEMLRVDRMVRVELLLAASLLDAPLPTEILRRAQTDTVAMELVGRLSQRLLGRLAGEWGAYARFRYRQRLVPGVARGWAYASRLTLTPAEEDWTMLQLPPALAPLYVALRPLRLMRKYGFIGNGENPR